jgi:urea transport system permease protein
VAGAVRSVLLLLALLTAALVPAQAQAQTLEDLLKPFVDGSFNEKAAAVDALGTLGDARAAPVLRAMQADRLLIKDGKLLVGEAAGPGFKLIDPLTGREVGTAAASEVERVRINNRVRSALGGALSKLVLFSPDRNERLAAAREAVKFASAESAATLEKALAREGDAAVRAAMEFALNAARISLGSKEQRIAAIAALAGTTEPAVRQLLGQVRNAPDVDPDVKAAAQKALESIERRLAVVGVAANVFQGVSLGSVLLLAAIGLAITFGVMGVINMAHGEMIMLGAYSAFVVQEVFRAWLPKGMEDYYLVVAVPVGFLVAAAFGVLIERTVIRFLYGRALETLLATWGISLMLQQLVRSVFGAPNKEVSNPSWMTGGFEITAGFIVTWNRLIIIFFCLAVLGALALALRYTFFGLQMRAVAQNREMAAAMGVPTARVDAMTFALGSGIAGMAGVALSQIGNVSPNLGTIYIVDSFMVVVFGGVGNLAGTFIGSMLLGVINKLLEPYAGAVLGKIAVLVIIILFIQWRPRGLFAMKGRAVES